MSNTTIETLTLWDGAVTYWEDGNYEDAINSLIQIPQPTAKILFNIGTIYLQRGQHDSAIQALKDAIEKDDHLAIAYYQLGCAYYELKRYNECVRKFEDCQSRFRGRNVIDYSQLGLRHKLYACEALYNAGVAHSHLRNIEKARDCLREAQKCKAESKHKEIDTVLQTLNVGNNNKLFKLSKDSLFRPSKAHLNNIQKKDYLGKAKVIAASDKEDQFAGFLGPQIREEISASSAPNSPLSGRRRNVESDGQKSPKLGLFEKLKQTGRKMSSPDILETIDKRFGKQKKSPSSSNDSSPEGTIERSPKSPKSPPVVKSKFSTAPKVTLAKITVPPVSMQEVIRDFESKKHVHNLTPPRTNIISYDIKPTNINDKHNVGSVTVEECKPPPIVPRQHQRCPQQNNTNSITKTSNVSAPKDQMIPGTKLKRSDIPPPPNRPPPKLKEFKPLPSLPSK